MAKNLVIVESPAKAKTIEKFLGKDFKVTSSYGHIRDLVSKELGVDIEKDFHPNYVIPNDKKEKVKELKKLAKAAETIWLASDEDREGEAIAWHLAETLNLPHDTTKRIVFHEITKTAIEKAIKNPRIIDANLVNAQQARRILDRLVGYELSPVLWKKVKPGLSAGRVQSVAVRLIVERERQIQSFDSKNYFRVTGTFLTDANQPFSAELNKRLENKEESQAFLQSLKGAKLKIDDLQKKPAKKSPAPPFTTSTLQQEAARKLGYPVSMTMSVAQRLYEAGHITYMRTDSVNLSNDAMTAAAAEITKEYSKEYVENRRYATKNKGAQEAHEAIRPTYMDKKIAGADDQQKRLYDLIRKRTLASQMADAQLERTTATINTPDNNLNFVAKGEIIKFEGFLKVYLEGRDDDDEDENTSGMLPAMRVNMPLDISEIHATERFTKAPARYTEASLVKKLEELGIGRPSTYAPTISTIIKREYVHKPEREGVKRQYLQIALDNKGEISSANLSENTGAERGKLAPTDIGMVVNDFLVEHFNEVLDFHFTAAVEEEFDKIAEGQKDWVEMLKKFYSDFHPKIDDTLENAERAKGERLLGQDPKTGKNIYARIGRYGAMVQKGEAEDEEKPTFASLRPGQSIDTLTYEEALDLFKLPRELGEYEGKMLKANVGRFGPYVQWGGTFASIKAADGDDPMTIEFDRAVEILEAKRQADREKFIASFDDQEPTIEILKGRWGPYIKVGKNNVKIPKDVDPLTLTRKDCEEIIKNAPAKKGGRAGGKKTAAKKTTTRKKATTKKTSAKKK
ncbi:MAG: type I DNA topoisomerase [Cryomorphaceae bacterium]|nr:type I DNA topoisomerase [Cryomorphaceae bacterium]